MTIPYGHTFWEWQIKKENTMSDIQYMEKPDWVSWDSIRECLNASHQTNKKKGFEMENAHITTDGVIKKFGDCRVFIALEGDKVVGVSCFKLMKRRRWYVNGTIVYYLGDAILPEYRGSEVYFGINDLRDKAVNESGVRIHQFNTSADNKTVIKMNKIYGYKLVQFTPTAKGCNYYSVTMVRWDNGCPFPEWFINFMFNLSKFVSKALWKPGYRWRFWFY